MWQSTRYSCLIWLKFEFSLKFLPDTVLIRRCDKVLVIRAWFDWNLNFLSNFCLTEFLFEDVTKDPLFVPDLIEIWIFSKIFAWHSSHSRMWQSTRYSCLIWLKFEFSLKFLPDTVLIRRCDKVPVIRAWFDWNLNFLGKFSKNARTSNLMKIRRVGAGFFHADWRRDRNTWRNW